MDFSALVEQNVPDYIYKNYFTAGGYAYTEDRFIVHKLFVNKIPRKTTISKVRKYFSSFGKILTVRFFADNNGYYPNVAFVHFDSPLVAARVLNFYHKSSVGKTYACYRVLACDSWNQPDCHPTKSMMLDYQLIPPNIAEILLLNDDCLDAIIRLLPISSQLRFARSCSRICQVFQNSSKCLYRTLYLDRLVNLTKWEMRDFFDFVGDNIISVAGTLPEQNPQLVLKLMIKYCRNIEELYLGSSVELHSKKDTFKLLFDELKKLKLKVCQINFNCQMKI